ncbi:MAG: hypothetical protein E6G97_11960 [Alphaproteobacteria bacterium]|nr:MAG: hypothetical protein E6G97_11960 [Alphaproteobacteria bacterium]
MKAPLLISAVLGALTLGLFGGPLGSFADQSKPAVRAPAITIDIDRTRKGDRRAPAQPTITTIEKTNGAPGLDPVENNPRLAPVKLGDCEPLASPVADRALGKWAGRCVV